MMKKINRDKMIDKTSQNNKKEKEKHPKVQYIMSFMLILLVLLSTACMQKEQKNKYAPDESSVLNIYTSHKIEVYGPIIKEFEERYGIWVEVTTGGTNELLEQISYESQDTVCDVIFGGGVENLEAYSEYFEPYKCAESDMLDETFVSETNQWTAFSSLPIVIIYNNKLVYDSIAPKGWKDLLEERWKGKIAFGDPYNSGSCFTALSTLIQAMQTEYDNVLQRFAYVVDKNVLSGSGEVVESVVKGTRLIGITLEETAMKKIAAGADISMIYPVEGTSAVPDGSALIKGAPHEANAKLFLDFIVSKDVQQLIVDEFYRRPVRKDITVSSMESAELGSLWNEQDIKIINYDLKWASSHQSELLQKWSELIQ